MTNGIGKIEVSTSALRPLYGIEDLTSDVRLTRSRMHISLPSGDISTEGDLYLTTNPRLNIEFRSMASINNLSINNLDLFAAYANNQVKCVVENFPDTQWDLLKLDPLWAEANPSHISTIKDVRVQSLKFHIVNFHNFIGSGVQTEENGRRRERITLLSNNWRVIIDSLPETKNAINKIRKTSGYAITHVGKLEKENKQQFKACKGCDVLEILFNFLSFARGAWVPIPIREGYNSKGKSVWSEWIVPAHYSPWKFVYSWFDGRQASENLPLAFNGFFQLSLDSKWKEVLPRTIYWYILSNTMQNIDGSIILAQAILELLAWNYLVISNGDLSINKFEKKSAKERFELLLESLIIPLSIPEGLTTLAKEAKSKNINGIGLITNMRNSLIHPRSKSKSSSHTSLLLLEARNLALWYVEMIILRLCNYDGFYSNRVLGRMRWAGEVELVPWELK